MRWAMADLAIRLPKGASHITKDGAPCGPDDPNRLAFMGPVCGFWSDHVGFLQGTPPPIIPKCPSCGQVLCAIDAVGLLAGLHLPAKDRDPRYLEFIRDSKGVCLKALGGMHPAWQASLSRSFLDEPPHSPASAMPPPAPKGAFGEEPMAYLGEKPAAPDPRGEPVSYMLMARCHNADIPLFMDPHEKCVRGAAGSVGAEATVVKIAEKIFPALKPFTPHILSIGFIPVYKGGAFGEYVAVNVVEAGQGKVPPAETPRVNLTPFSVALSRTDLAGLIQGGTIERSFTRRLGDIVGEFPVSIGYDDGRDDDNDDSDT